MYSNNIKQEFSIIGYKLNNTHCVYAIIHTLPILPYRYVKNFERILVSLMTSDNFTTELYVMGEEIALLARPVSVLCVNSARG